MRRRFVLKGNICYSESPGKLRILEHGVILCEDGICQGVAERVPEEWRMEPVRDYGGRLIIPGLADLHIHAPQYGIRGMGIGQELLKWMEQQVFPEEARYGDLEYARRAYGIFVESLRRGAATRACIFATPHLPATLLLMEMLEPTGLKVMVGKVNMDRNSPDILREDSASASAADTLLWLDEAGRRFTRVKPILTPGYIPGCSDELMERLKEIRIARKLPVQSHLSESSGTARWVGELFPDVEFYGDAHDRHGLLGGEGGPAVMAHCVCSGVREQQRMKERGVWVAHCPQVDLALACGIAPVREFLDRGIKVGLGSGVAGGSGDSMLRAITDAVRASRLRWGMQDGNLGPLTFEEAFYMATQGGGSFFGKVGSFSPGYELDAVVLDDRKLGAPREFSVRERLERICCLGDDRQIEAKYVAGREILHTKNIYGRRAI